MDQKIEAPTTLYLEDLYVHQRFTSALYHMEEDRIKAFGLAASGWHTAAVTMRLLVGSLPFASGMIGLGGEIAWPKPTRPGDTLRVESEILEIVASRSKPNQGVVIVRCITLNQKGDHVQAFTAKILVFKRPGDPNNTILKPSAS
jgi:acyl dehydratase